MHRSSKSDRGIDRIYIAYGDRKGVVKRESHVIPYCKVQGIHNNTTTINVPTEERQGYRYLLSPYRSHFPELSTRRLNARTNVIRPFVAGGS